MLILGNWGRLKIKPMHILNPLLTQGCMRRSGLVLALCCQRRWRTLHFPSPYHSRQREMWDLEDRSKAAAILILWKSLTSHWPAGWLCRHGPIAWPAAPARSQTDSLNSESGMWATVLPKILPYPAGHSYHWGWMYRETEAGCNLSSQDLLFPFQF